MLVGEYQSFEVHSAPRRRRTTGNGRTASVAVAMSREPTPGDAEEDLYLDEGDEIDEDDLPVEMVAEEELVG